jgi:hypothetical protein
MTPPSNAGGEGREVLANIRARICEQGDMHITVSAEEMATLRQALGLGWWEDQDERREIDAMALEMLCVAAEKRAAMLAFSARENADDRAPALVEAAVAEMREKSGCRHHVHIDDSLAFADQISNQHRLRADAAEARLRLIIDTLIDKGESWQAYSGRLRAIAWDNQA